MARGGVVVVDVVEWSGSGSFLGQCWEVGHVRRRKPVGISLYNMVLRIDQPRPLLFFMVFLCLLILHRVVIIVGVAVIFVGVWRGGLH